MVSQTVQIAQRDFEGVATGVREEVQQFIKKELQAKEATIDNKMEKNKVQFLKVVNGNMRILDNLISDYTTRTHEQIKKQLRSGDTRPSSRGALHKSNQEVQDTGELNSIQGSSLS